MDAWEPAERFIWDRHIGKVIAPIGEYPVSVKAWDLLGNSTSAAGLILIPPPEEPKTSEDVTESLSEPASGEAPEPTAPPSVGELSFEPAATDEPVVAGLVDEPAASIGSAEPATTTTTSEGGSGTLLWGAAALAAAASATAFALSRRQDRQEQIEKMRKEAVESASPGAFAQRLSSLRARAEAVVAPIRNSMIIAAAATQAAVELARQRAEEARRQRAEQFRAEREERAEQAERRAALEPPSTPVAETPQVDAWQRIELQRAQEYAGYPRSSPPNIFSEPLGFIDHYADLAKNVLRGFAVFNLFQAAREIDITQVTTTLRITGSRSARNTLGFREMVNWLRPENIEVLPQSPALRATRSLKSWGAAFGLGLGLASDTSEYLSGNYDRHEYAASLTIDTGITIALTLASGAIAGAATGFAVGLVGGGVSIPIVGAVPGAVLGALVGGLIGIGSAIVLGGLIEVSGVREFLIEKVTQLYRSWTGTAETSES